MYPIEGHSITQTVGGPCCLGTVGGPCCLGTVGWPCCLGTVGGPGGADGAGELGLAGLQQVAGEGRGRLLRERVPLTEPRVEPGTRKR